MKRSTTVDGESSRLQNADHTEYFGEGVLWANERDLRRYNASVVSMLSQGNAEACPVLEFGAGIGTLANIWRESTGIAPVCLEIDQHQLEVIAQRGLVCHGDIADIKGKFELIYTSNVLEHIDDDVASIRQLHDLLSEGGTLAIFVPAFMCLYSKFDSDIGHYRRYGMKELKTKLITSGFAIEVSHYADSIGFFAWLWMRLRGTGADATAASNRSLAVYDRYIYPLSRFADRIGFRWLFGKNILIIARKKPSTLAG